MGDRPNGNLATFGPCWPLLASFGPWLPLLAHFDLFWLPLIHVGLCWPMLVPYGPVWPLLAQFEPCWSFMAPFLFILLGPFCALFENNMQQLNMCMGLLDHGALRSWGF